MHSCTPRSNPIKSQYSVSSNARWTVTYCFICRVKARGQITKHTFFCQDKFITIRSIQQDALYWNRKNKLLQHSVGPNVIYTWLHNSLWHFQLCQLNRVLHSVLRTLCQQAIHPCQRGLRRHRRARSPRGRVFGFLYSTTGGDGERLNAKSSGSSSGEVSERRKARTWAKRHRWTMGFRDGEESERSKSGRWRRGQQALIRRRAKRGAEATVWRAGPCVNGDVLNLC